MRKIIVFLVLLTVFAVFFSCNFQLPTALEVFGNSELKFSAQKDIGEMLEDKLEMSDFDLITCVNTDTRTHIFRKNISDNFELSQKKPGQSDMTSEGEIISDIELDTNTITISLDFSKVLPNFELKPVKARLYIHGSNLSDVIEVDINNSSFNFNKESVSFNNGLFTGTSLPGSQRDELTLTLNDVEQTIPFSVIIPAGAIVDPDWFDQPLKADFLIWLPLEFIAISDDAQIVFPDNFLFSGDDLFGRGKPDDSNPTSDYIESLELSINLKQNAFKGRELVVWSQPGLTKPDFNEDIIIRQTLTGNAFVIPIDSETMEKINNPVNFPFSPQFLFEYEENEELIIPREFVSTEFVFKAKVNYRKEF